MATLMKVLFVGTLKECKDLERKLRPQPRIGWNRVSGGAHFWTPNWEHPESIPCVLYWIYDSILHTNHEHEGYIGVTTQALKERLVGHKRRWPDLAIDRET